jgi:hypothetical protein
MLRVFAAASTCVDTSTEPLTRAPADLALALYYLLSATLTVLAWLFRALRTQPGPIAQPHTLRYLAELADTRRAVSTRNPLARARSQDYVCLHALSSFQRTGFRKDPTATRPRCATSLTEVPT